MRTIGKRLEDTTIQGLGDLPSPKLSVADKAASIYPYYAGFSRDFVNALFDLLCIRSDSRVLDPWNGSGTTTHVAWARSTASMGVELNPVLVDIARARCASKEAALLLAGHYGRSTLNNVKNAPLASSMMDLKSVFDRAASLIPEHREREGALDLLKVAFYSALRKSAEKPKNPTWMKGLDLPKINLEMFSSLLGCEVHRVVQVKGLGAGACAFMPVIKQKNFTNFDIADISRFDYVVTSPPYLTRVDYVKATYPELTYIAALEDISLTGIRRLMLGSPLTSNAELAIPPDCGPEAIRLLRSISEHPSKASATYYRRFYAQYFASFCLSMHKIAALLVPGGIAALVVQDSFYKELPVRLAEITSEMGERCGMRTIGWHEFPQRRSIVSINSRSIASRSEKRSSEYLVLMRKGCK